MDGRFEVTRAGLSCGVAELSQNGLMLDINFSGMAPDSENVYRLAAVCSGRNIMIGVPVPDKSGKLILKKRFSKSSLRELGFDSPEGFCLVLPNENSVDNSVENSNEAEDTNDNEAEERNWGKPETKEPDILPKVIPPEEAPVQKTDDNISNLSPKVPDFEPRVLVPDNMPINRYSAQRQNAQRQTQDMQRQNMQKQNPWMRGPQRENSGAKEINQKQPEKANPAEKIKRENQPKQNKPEQETWKPVENPAVMFAENGVLSNVDNIKGALIREEGEFIHLAVPVSEGEPFPLMSAFCLGEPQTINNGDYLVFKLKNGAFTA